MANLRLISFPNQYPMLFLAWYWLLIVFIAAVLTGGVYFYFRGRYQVKYFLWVWLGMLLLYAYSKPAIDPKNVHLEIVLALVLFFSYLVVLYRDPSFKANQAEQELNRVLNVLNERIDSERTRISRHLHDELNPKLILSMQELRSQLRNPELTPSSRIGLENALAQIDSAYQDVRTIIRNTRSEIIDTIGLSAAIESLVGHYQAAFQKPKITLKHNLPSKPALDKKTSLSLYRVVQELLINAVKHSNAEDLQIKISQTLGRYDFEVADNGVGIELNRDRSSDGIGLIDIRQRVERLGGHLKIDNGPEGVGTIIKFSIVSRD